MKLTKLTCPNCEGMLEIDSKHSQTHIFCPYCGQKFLTEDGKNKITIHNHVNNSFNLTKNVHPRERRSIDPDVAKAFGETFLKILVLVIIVCFIRFYIPYQNELSAKTKAEEEVRINAAIQAGMITAGWHGDYEELDYEVVIEQLKARGFENFECIDAKDSGLAFWDNNKVISISIGGDANFDSNDYFFPTDKVIITHH